MQKHRPRKVRQAVAVAFLKPMRKCAASGLRPDEDPGSENTGPPKCSDGLSTAVNNNHALSF